MNREQQRIIVSTYWAFHLGMEQIKVVSPRARPIAPDQIPFHDAKLLAIDPTITTSAKQYAIDSLKFPAVDENAWEQHLRSLPFPVLMPFPLVMLCYGGYTMRGDVAVEHLEIIKCREENDKAPAEELFIMGHIIDSELKRIWELLFVVDYREMDFSDLPRAMLNGSWKNAYKYYCVELYANGQWLYPFLVSSQVVFSVANEIAFKCEAPETANLWFRKDFEDYRKRLKFPKTAIPSLYHFPVISDRKLSHVNDEDYVCDVDMTMNKISSLVKK